MMIWRPSIRPALHSRIIRYAGGFREDVPFPVGWCSADSGVTFDYSLERSPTFFATSPIRRAGEYARLNEGLGVCGEVGFGEWFGGDRPHRPPIPTSRIDRPAEKSSLTPSRWGPAALITAAIDRLGRQPRPTARDFEAHPTLTPLLTSDAMRCSISHHGSHHARPGPVGPA